MSDAEETWGDWFPEPVPPPYVRPSLRRHTYRIWRAEGGAALETPGGASGEISRICQDGFVEGLLAYRRSARASQLNALSGLFSQDGSDSDASVSERSGPDDLSEVSESSCRERVVRAPGSLTMLRTPIGLDGLQDPSLEDAFPTPMPRALDLHDSGKVPFPLLEEVPTSSERGELMTDHAPRFSLTRGVTVFSSGPDLVADGWVMTDNRCAEIDALFEQAAQGWYLHAKGITDFDLRDAVESLPVTGARTRLVPAKLNQLSAYRRCLAAYKQLKDGDRSTFHECVQEPLPPGWYGADFSLSEDEKINIVQELDAIIHRFVVERLGAAAKARGTPLVAKAKAKIGPGRPVRPNEPDMPPPAPRIMVKAMPKMVVPASGVHPCGPPVPVGLTKAPSTPGAGSAPGTPPGVRCKSGGPPMEFNLADSRSLVAIARERAMIGRQRAEALILAKRRRTEEGLTFPIPPPPPGAPPSCPAVGSVPPAPLEEPTAAPSSPLAPPSEVSVPESRLEAGFDEADEDFQSVAVRAAEAIASARAQLGLGPAVVPTDTLTAADLADIFRE